MPIRNPSALTISALLLYWGCTTLFQYWVVALVSERVRRHDRLGVALVNMALMPVGQALILALFVAAIGTRPAGQGAPVHLPGVFQLLTLWLSAILGVLLGGLLLAMLPRVGKYLREPELSVFFGGLFAALTYKYSGVGAGLRQAWLLALGLLVLAKIISWGCRYAVGFLVTEPANLSRAPRATPQLFLSLVIGTSTTLMLVPLVTLLGL